MTIVLLTLETRNFHFQCAGHTYDEALAGIKAAWEAHRKEYGRGGRDIWTWEQVLEENDLRREELVLGRGYRDHEPLPRK